LRKGVYRGPHYFSHTPMVRIMLDLGRMEEWPSNRIPGFTDAMLALLPGLGGTAAAETPRRLRQGG
jgi:cyanophycin synthetase